MHHLTTLNLPTAPARENDRRSLLVKVGAYLASGGQVGWQDLNVKHLERLVRPVRSVPIQ